jgi:hypothetical protein
MIIELSEVQSFGGGALRAIGAPLPTEVLKVEVVKVLSHCSINPDAGLIRTANGSGFGRSL